MTRHISTLVSVALMLAAPAVVSAGAGGGPRTGVLRLDAKNLGQVARNKFKGALYEGLGEVTSYDACRVGLLAKAPELLACKEGPCLAKVGELLGIDVGLMVSFREDMGTYETKVAAVELSTGEELLSDTWLCEICTMEEASSGVVAKAKGFREALLAKWEARKPAPSKVDVRLVTEPPGAKVKVDGELVGISPVTVALPEGSHRVEVVQEGYQGVRRALKVEGEEPLEIQFVLEPQEAPALPEAVVAPPARPGERGRVTERPGQPAPWWRLEDPDDYGYVGIAAGLVLTGLGAVLMGMDGDPTCDGPLESCPEVYDTGTFGMVSAGLGAGLLAGAAVFFLTSPQTDGVAPSHTATQLPLTLHTF